MEKYAKLMKGLEVCAGPDCCKDGCPYYGETTGSMTCRARLLADAAIAINNEQALRESAEEGLQNAIEKLGKLDTINTTICAERENLRKELATVNGGYRSMTNELSRLHADVDDLEAANHTLRAERDTLRLELEEKRPALKATQIENDILHQRCQVQQNEINALLLKNGEKDEKTDRPSVSSDDLENLACELQRYRTEAGYWHGKAAALEWFIREWFREGGFAP